MKLFYLLILFCLPFVGNTQSVTTYNRSAWTVTASSEELTSDGPINGRAATMLDGDSSTYWLSRQSDSIAVYPHKLVFDMKMAQPVNQLYLLSNRDAA